MWIVSEARELFQLIGTYDGTEGGVKSELLGENPRRPAGSGDQHLRRADGCIRESPLRQSDLALQEFSDPRDLSRQYQLRCLLMLEGGRTDDAYQALLRPADSADSPKGFLEQIYALKEGSDDFQIWHYTAVMTQYRQAGHPLGEQMARALKACPQFTWDLQDQNQSVHPWELILWNIAKHERMNGNDAGYLVFFAERSGLFCKAVNQF